jgi:hypothetical protein
MDSENTRKLDFGAGMKFEDAELILGHKLRYYKVDESHLASQFVKFMDGLSLTQELKLKRELENVTISHG